MAAVVALRLRCMPTFLEQVVRVAGATPTFEQDAEIGLQLAEIVDPFHNGAHGLRLGETSLQMQTT
jgi:hypothetical protein